METTTTHMYSPGSEEGLNLNIPLVLNEAAADELGPGSAQYSKDDWAVPELTVGSPGEEENHAVYEDEFLGFYSSIRLHPLRFGFLQPEDLSDSGCAPSQHVIVMTLDLTFHPSKPQKYRFRNAIFSVQFARPLDHKNGNAPKVLAFSPSVAYGHSTSAIKKTNQATFEFTVPVFNVAKGNFGYSTEVDRKSRFSILGSPRGSPASRIVWTLDEGEGTHEGLPLNVKMAILLSASAPFEVFFDIDTDIGLLQEAARTPRKLARSIAALWSGDVSTKVKIDPGAIRESLKKKGVREDMLSISGLVAYTSFTGPEEENNSVTVLTHET